MAEEGPRWNDVVGRALLAYLASLDPTWELPEQLTPERARALLLARPDLLEITRRDLATAAANYWLLASYVAQWQQEAAALAMLAEQMASRQTRPV